MSAIKKFTMDHGHIHYLEGGAGEHDQEVYHRPWTYSLPGAGRRWAPSRSLPWTMDIFTTWRGAQVSAIKKSTMDHVHIHYLEGAQVSTIKKSTMDHGHIHYLERGAGECDQEVCHWQVHQEVVRHAFDGWNEKVSIKFKVSDVSRFYYAAVLNCIIIIIISF